MATLFNPAVFAFTDDNGNPLAGGKVYFYQTGTSTPLDTWSDDGLTALNTNPVTLNAAGRPQSGAIYLGAHDYKVIVKNASDVQVGPTMDPVHGFMGGDSKSVFLSDFQDLATADAFAADANLILIIDTDVTLTTNTALLAKEVNFRGGIITRGIFTLSGNFSGHPTSQWFDASGVGTVTLNNGGPVYLINFGGNAGAADNLNPLTQMVKSIAGGAGQGTLGFINKGIFKINGEVPIPFSQGGRLLGLGVGSVIEQTANNTPIFAFRFDLTWGWEIGCFAGTWTTQQTGSNTLSNIFFFGTNGANYFANSFHDIFSSKGYSTFREDNSVSPVIWNTTITDIQHGSSMVGPWLDFRQAATGGQSNNMYERINARMGNKTAGVFAMYIQGHTACTINQLDIGDMNDPNGASLISSEVQGDTWKLGELGTVTTSGNLILATSGSLRLGRLALGRITINGPGITVNGLNTSACPVTIQGDIQQNLTLTQGAFFLYSSGDSVLDCGNITGVTGSSAFTWGSSVFAWANIGGNNTANFIRNRTLDNVTIAADAGNADAAFTPGATNNVFLFDTPITAARYVVCANSYNLAGNIRVKIIRTLNATGAFAVGFKRPDGTVVASIASAPGAGSSVVEVGYRDTGATPNTSWYQTSN